MERLNRCCIRLDRCCCKDSGRALVDVVVRQFLSQRLDHLILVPDTVKLLAERAACEHTPHAVEKQIAGNEIQSAS